MEAAPQSQTTFARRLSACLPALGCEGLRALPLPQRNLCLAAALLLAGGLALRLWLLGMLFQVNGDAQIYGGIAKNLLLHGSYALNGAGSEVYPTLIRLPGYPFFLAACFRLFGMENYWAAAVMQIGLELTGCLLLADFARRIAPPRQQTAAALATLALAALCPFTASYSAVPLTETPTLFAIALALWAAAGFRTRPGWSYALTFTFAITFAALLRPDGALLGVALAPALLVGLRHEPFISPFAGRFSAPALRFFPGARVGDPESQQSAKEECRSQSDLRQQRKFQVPHPFRNKRGKDGARRLAEKAAFLRMGAICILLALLPFALWGGRNWKVFHVVQPLAPRYATDPGEDTHPGWIRWVKTWCLDFNCTSQIYWPVPGDRLEVSALPARAFDSPRQQEETAALAEEYNRSGMDLTPSLDGRFARLADARERAHPLRSHLLLPLGRMADMWLRPRTENLPIDLDWWVYKNHHRETVFAWFYVGLNAAFLLLGVGGLLLRPRLWPWLLLCILLRCALLCTVEAPEARYTLECFPMLFVWGGFFLSWVWTGRSKRKTAAV
jgi:hypothetical protein